MKSHFKRSVGVHHLAARSSVLLSAPQQHTGRPQPPSVLICFDCFSLIIENNKVRSFLSCLVCCLSLRPWLSDTAERLDPLDPNGSSCHVRARKDGRRECPSPAESRRLCFMLEKRRSSTHPYFRSEIHFSADTRRF